MQFHWFMIKSQGQMVKIVWNIPLREISKKGELLIWKVLIIWVGQSMIQGKHFVQFWTLIIKLLNYLSFVWSNYKIWLYMLQCRCNFSKWDFCFCFVVVVVMRYRSGVHRFRSIIKNALISRRSTCACVTKVQNSQGYFIVFATSRYEIDFFWTSIHDNGQVFHWAKDVVTNKSRTVVGKWDQLWRVFMYKGGISPPPPPFFNFELNFVYL